MKKIYVFASMMLAVALNYSCAKMDSPAFPSQDTPTEEAEGTKYLINVDGETHEVMLIGTFNAEKGTEVAIDYLEGDANDYYGVEIDGAMTATGKGSVVDAKGTTTTGIIKVYGNKGLKDLRITNAYPTETTFKNEWMATLETLVFSNPYSETIVLPETLTKLNYLDITNSKIKTIDVSKFTTLVRLEIKKCPNFESIDVTKNTNLTTLILSDNKLKSIDVSKNTKLTALNVANNNAIETLDVTALTALKELNADKNKLKAIDITKNTKLESLSLANNQFTIATLPTKPAGITAETVDKYSYAPQAPMEVAKSFKVGETIDLTAQLYAQGVIDNQATTEFKFYADGSQLKNGVDYEKTEDAGLVYKFLKAHDKVVCKMTTEAFPKLVDFQTTEFKIEAAAAE